MNHLLKSVLITALGLIVSLGSLPAHAAVRSIHAGAICQPYTGSQSGILNAQANGVYNTSATASVRVTCPIVRGTMNSNGANVWVEVNRGAATTTPLSCTLYSYEWDGNLLGSYSGSFGGVGVGAIALNVSGAGKSSVWSHYAVSCNLPAQSRITNISVDEL